MYIVLSFIYIDCKYFIFNLVKTIKYIHGYNRQVNNIKEAQVGIFGRTIVIVTDVRVDVIVLH